MVVFTNHSNLLKAACILVGLFLLTACATSPLGRKQLLLLPASQIQQMGAASFANLKQKQPQVQNAQENAYVTCVAHTITRVTPLKVKWDVVLFKSKQVNAFALPGGKIGVYSGLLKVAKTPSQLAAVIGHEVGHVIAHHGNERMSMQYVAKTGTQLLSALYDGDPGTEQTVLTLLGAGAQYGVILPYSRTQEAEADLIGLKLMAKAGFDPRAAVRLWVNMSQKSGAKPPELLSTHPSDAHRIANIKQHLPDALAAWKAARQAGSVPQCTPDKLGREVK